MVEATIRWTPALPGTYDVVVRIDSVNQGVLRSSVFYPYQITVDPVNDAPVFNSLPLVNLVENQLYVYNIDVTDEDDPSVNLQLITNDIPEFALECDDPSDFVQIFASDKKLQGTTNLAGVELLEASYPEASLHHTMYVSKLPMALDIVHRLLSSSFKPIIIRPQ